MTGTQGGERSAMVMFLPGHWRVGVAGNVRVSNEALSLQPVRTELVVEAVRVTHEALVVEDLYGGPCERIARAALDVNRAPETDRLKWP